MSTVRATKDLGQHYLNDMNAAQNIIDALDPNLGFKQVLEVGPGMGVLSDFLLQKDAYETWLIDVDEESIAFLAEKYTQLDHRLIHGDFLTLDFGQFFGDSMAVIGNFPYNISSQILFKILAERQRVVQMVGMFQKEVAERCVAKKAVKSMAFSAYSCKPIMMYSISLRLKLVLLTPLQKCYRASSKWPETTGKHSIVTKNYFGVW